MPNDLTVTFGGGEVVLRRVVGSCILEGVGVPIVVHESAAYRRSVAYLSVSGKRFGAEATTPQAAVSAVEAKLRSMVREIQGALGGSE